MASWAVFLPNWIGDVAMATPALRALRQHLGPHASLIGVIRPYVAEVLAGTPWCDEYLAYDKKFGFGPLSRWQLVRELRRRKLAGTLLFTNSFSTALLAWLSGARLRVGYARYGRQAFLTHSLPPLKQGTTLAPVSAVDYYLSLAQAAGASAQGPELSLATVPGDEVAADLVWKKFSWQGQRVVALNPGAAYGAAKHWPREHFASLARELVARQDLRVLVLCGPSERAEARAIEQLAASPGVRTLADEQLSIGLTKACLRRCTALVSTDSGPRHLAAGFGIPTVALFGPTDPRWSHNYNPLEIQLGLNLECRPCARRTCPLGHHRCLRELLPNQVLAAVEQLLVQRQAGVA